MELAHWRSIALPVLINDCLWLLSNSGGGKERSSGCTQDCIQAHKPLVHAKTNRLSSADSGDGWHFFKRNRGFHISGNKFKDPHEPFGDRRVCERTRKKKILDF
uniref:Uncharacterized protein n=1 Tax=Caenorhabditis japonica TaxID=281687 RepID=A0A8R1IRQ2_CAEJA